MEVSGHMLGSATVAAAHVEIDALPAGSRKKLPRYPLAHALPPFVSRPVKQGRVDRICPSPRNDDGRILHMQAMGRATVEDLRRVPEKAELVGGEIVRMSAVSARHG